jgi:hypothetical protein
LEPTSGVSPKIEDETFSYCTPASVATEAYLKQQACTGHGTEKVDAPYFQAPDT